MNGIFRIGITGPTGAGKGAVSSLFSSVFGILVCDADKIYHEILESNEKCRLELVESFGDGILSNGRIDRRALASVVFADGASKKLLLLNEITHRYVIDETERRIEKARTNGEKYAVVDAPLLIEADMHLSCDRVICVLSDKETRLSRILKRDGISEEQALMRINKQKSDDFYMNAADVVIYNNGDMCDLEKKVREVAASFGISNGEAQ